MKQVFNPLIKEGFQQLGTGFEPFIEEFSLFPVQIQQSFQEPITLAMANNITVVGTGNDNYAFPFIVQQPVKVNGYSFFIDGPLSVNCTFTFCIYEYVERVGTTTIRFSKVYNENRPNQLSIGDGGGFEYTIDSYTLQPGKVYICCVIPDDGSNFVAQAIQHNGITNLPIPCNKVLGSEPVGAVNNAFRIGVKFDAVVDISGVPATIDADFVYVEQAYNEYLRLTLQNA